MTCSCRRTRGNQHCWCVPPWDRRVDQPEKYLWATLESQPVAGPVTIEVPRQADRPARQAQLSLRYTAVTLPPPPHRRHEGLQPLTVWAVLAHEANAPVGCEPIEWLWLTTVPIESFAQAAQCVQWYTGRWLIEVYHKVLKSGCRVEERQFDDGETIKRYLAVDCVVAWRELPDLPCTATFEAQEWQALYCFTHPLNTPPAQVPSLQPVVRGVARLGGFQGRTADGEPGVIVIWRGLQRLHDITIAWQLFHTPRLTPKQKNVGKD